MNNNLNTSTEKEGIKKKSWAKEWLDAIVFAVVVATFVRWIFLEAFTIPTPSMEKSLLVGDFLFVSKVHYGARTPKTPLQVPLTHQKIWGTEIPSYSTLIQLPQFRLPGFSKIKNNDVVVFNWPADYQYPTDLKTNYIKRCIGIAGDTLSLKRHVAFINGKKAHEPEMMQYRYTLFSSQMINDKVFKKLDISEHYNIPGGYLLFTTPERAAKLKEMAFVEQLNLADMPPEEPNPRVYPLDPKFGWNEDNYGPIWIPKEGATTVMDARNAQLYFKMIQEYEYWEDVKLENGKLMIDGKPVEKYTWKQNYYFMMGDNRHNSEDSRFWGFVPEDHVVGKAWLIWMSLDPDNKFVLDGIRWRRLFNLID